MKIGKISAIILFAAMLMMVFAVPVKAAKGPKTGDLIDRFYANVEATYAALKGGSIDGVLYELSPDLVTDAQGDQNLVLAGVADTGFYEFDLNNNYTLQELPTYTNPMSYLEMRQAVAWCTNKPLIVSVFCGGFAERIDQMIAAPLKAWANASYWYPNYPYEYNPASAAAVLDTKFPKGSTANPYYSPAFPGSSDKIRTYPAGHEKAGQNLDPLIFCVRSDDNRRYQAGILIVDNMRKMGIPINSIEGTKTALYDRVMGLFNYHLYTGGWDVGRFPILSLYGLYHSDFYYAYGQNYLTGISQGNPKYPLLDQYLEDGNYALTYGEAITATKNAGGYMTIECINVPLWSSLAYWCYSKNLLGVTNTEGDGPFTAWTFMKAYKIDGSAIRVGQISPPNTVNIVYSNWVYDYNVLDRMTLYGGTDVPPYNLAADQPGFVKDWTVDTWDDHGETHTRVAMTFRSDGYFCEPVTGNQRGNVDADTYFFNAWYDFQVGNGWWSSGFIDLDHIIKTGQYSFEIYFNTASYFNLYYCQGPLRPIDVWSAQPELVTENIETFTNPTTPGYISLANNPVWIVSATFNGNPLTPFVDYNIDADTKGDPGRLHIYSTLGAGTLVVTYWSVNDPRGFTPGNLAWQTMFEGAGYYYITDFATTDYAVYKRNPFYYMETPPVGEIDFVRKENGAYKVDIFDLVMSAGAFGSQGTAVPSTNWFPGADLAPAGGQIDIFDEVTVTGSYGQEWDPPT